MYRWTCTSGVCMFYWPFCRQCRATVRSLGLYSPLCCSHTSTYRAFLCISVIADRLLVPICRLQSISTRLFVQRNNIVIRDRRLSNSFSAGQDWLGISMAKSSSSTASSSAPALQHAGAGQHRRAPGLAAVNPPARVRLLTTLSFPLLLLFAVPFWWYTTAIERLPLPVDRIDVLSNGAVSHEYSRWASNGLEALP